MQSLYRRAIGGNMTAARLVLERCMGLPVSSRTVELPALRDALTDEQARAAVIKAVGSGEIDIESGAVLARLASAGSDVSDYGGPYDSSEAFL